MDESTSLVPASSQPIRRRDKRGLRLNQKRALIALSQSSDWKAAAVAAGVEVRTLQEWLQNDPMFQEEYDNLLSGFLNEVKGRMSALLPRVGDVMQEGLDAERYEEVDTICPNCQHEYKAEVKIPAWAIRLRVMEQILKHKLPTTSKLEVSGEIQHISLTAEEAILLQRLRRFGPSAVPPGFADEMRQRGQVIEGEFTESSPDESLP
jgi:hypothetical protein